MAISEFRYNRKAKHYSYIFAKDGNFRKNILISTDEYRKVKRKNGTYRYIRNVPLYKHPNPNYNGKPVYLMNKIEKTEYEKFGNKKKTWRFHIFDKRKVKRVIKRKWK